MWFVSMKEFLQVHVDFEGEQQTVCTTLLNNIKFTSMTGMLQIQYAPQYKTDGKRTVMMH